ncbi:MAG TPA: DUF6292 family protein [Pseudonocardiaceae bacterium]|nr:DUF6292 family protein [Pseudonocardiaceae bacterium]
MPSLLDATMIDTPDEFAFARGLRGYLAAVATGLGVGLESCAIDSLSPAAAYVALDGRVQRFPERDLALLWEERFGWSAAVEVPSDRNLIVLTYHGGDLVPPPSEIGAFVAAVRSGDHSMGQPNPPSPAVPVARQELTLRLQIYERPR